jgi:hypothetical protein
MNAPGKEADSCLARTTGVCEIHEWRTKGRRNASRPPETDDDDEGGEEGALISRGPRSQQFGLVRIWSDDGDKDDINAEVLQQSKHISKVRPYMSLLLLYPFIEAHVCLRLQHLFKSRQTHDSVTDVRPLPGLRRRFRLIRGGI